jgi:hypothetical protein
MRRGWRLRGGVRLLAIGCAALIASAAKADPQAPPASPQAQSAPASAPQAAARAAPTAEGVTVPTPPKALPLPAATPSYVALLRGLYSTDPTQYGFMQRASIADAMRRDTRPR